MPVQDQEGYLLFLENSIYPAAEEVAPIDINPFTGFSFSIWLLGVCIGRMCVLWKGEDHQALHNDIGDIKVFPKIRTLQSITKISPKIRTKVFQPVHTMYIIYLYTHYNYAQTYFQLVPITIPLYEQTPSQAMDTGNSHAQAEYV